MPTSLPALRRPLLSLAVLAASHAATAQTLEVAEQPADRSFDTKAADPTFTLDLSQFIQLSRETGPLVILETDLGPIVLEMLPDDAPKNVENFLSYVEDQSYDQSIVHRSVPGFIIQGGGFTKVPPSTVGDVPQRDPVENEFKLSNLRGTVAMAKLGDDPDSATSEWFINLVDNSGNLDDQNGGFTVFARVLGNGMQVADAIAELPIGNLSGNLGSAFAETPLQGDTSGALTLDNLVGVTRAFSAPLFPTPDNPDSFARFTEVSSSDSSIADVALSGSALTLELGLGAVGDATITVTAEDPEGNAVELSFTVTLFDPFLTLDPPQAQVGFAASDYSLAIDSNTDWAAAGLPAWLTLSQTSGNGPAELTVAVTENDSLLPRYASFTLNDQAHSVLQDGDFDAWLAARFTPEQIQSMAPDAQTADSDGDDLSNRAEHLLGLDPSDPQSRLRTRVEAVDGAPRLTAAPFPGGVSAELQSSDDLLTWTADPVPDGVPSTDPQSGQPTLRFELPAGPERFYRILFDSPLLPPASE